MRCRTPNGPAIRFVRNLRAHCHPKNATPLARGRSAVLIVGGSLGAAALNETVPKAIALLDPAMRPRIVHQAGAKHIEALRSELRGGRFAARRRPATRAVHRRHGGRLRGRRSRDLPLGRDDGVGDRGGRRGGALRAVPVRRRRSPDHERRVPRKERRGATDTATRPRRRTKLAGWLQSQTRASLAEMAERSRELAKPDATERVAKVCADVAGMSMGVGESAEALKDSK